MEHISLRTAAGVLSATCWPSVAPVVLLHAGGERRSVWDPVGSVIASSTGRAVLAVDQRGHGDSRNAGPTNRLDGFIADVGHVLDFLGSSAVLVGASLGGFAALGAAERWPSRVDGVALVDVVPNLDPAAARTYLRTAASGRFDTAEIVEDILSRISEMTTWSTAITVPMLLIRGERSHIGQESIGALRSLCPQLEVRGVEDAGHLVAQDAPTELAGILCQFLDRIGGAPTESERP